jgi:hypothetical protein
MDHRIELRLGAALTESRALFGERWKAVVGYLAAAVIVPFLFFSAYPQATMRGFASLTLNQGAFYSQSTPFTILFLFLGSFFIMGAFVFCAWSALLTETRDEIAGEVMNGFVSALLACFVAMVIYIASSIPFSIPIFLIGNNASESVIVAISLILQLLSFAATLFLLARFGLAGPAMAATGSINPIAGLAQSWRMTSGNILKMLLVVAPFYIVAWVVTIGFAAIAIAVLINSDGTTWHDNALSGAWIVIEIVVLLAIILLPAGIYRSLQGHVRADVFE